MAGSTSPMTNLPENGELQCSAGELKFELEHNVSRADSKLRNSRAITFVPQPLILF